MSLELRYQWKRLYGMWIVCLGLVLVTGACVMMALGYARPLPWVPGPLLDVGLAAALFGFSLGMFGYWERSRRRREPVVCIGASGLLDRRLGEAAIPWTAVRGYEWCDDEAHRSDVVRLYVDEADERPGRRRRLVSILGDQVEIDCAGLTVPRSVIEATIGHYAISTDRLRAA